MFMLTLVGVIFNSVQLILHRDNLRLVNLFEIFIQLLFFAVYCTFRFNPYLKKRSYGQLTIFINIVGAAFVNIWSAWTLKNPAFKGAEETSLVNWVFFTYTFSTSGFLVHFILVAPFLLVSYYMILTGITQTWGSPYSELPVEEQNQEIINAYFNTHFTKFVIIITTMTLRCYIRSYDQAKKAIERAYLVSQQNQLSAYFSAMTDGVLIYSKPADKFDHTSRPGEEATDRKCLIDPATLF